MCPISGPQVGLTESSIENLPNRYNMFCEKIFAIYVLDDYAVHLMPEVRKVLYERGYILVVIGGGITGDVEVNDTHIHCPLKQHYRDEEAELMIRKLNENKNKVPTPDHSDVIRMTIAAWQKITVDFASAFKTNYVRSYILLVTKC